MIGEEDVEEEIDPRTLAGLTDGKGRVEPVENQNMPDPLNQVSYCIHQFIILFKFLCSAPFYTTATSELLTNA